MTYRPNTTIPLHAYFLDEDGAKIAVSGSTGDTLDGDVTVTATVTRIDVKPTGGFVPVTGWNETPMLLADTSNASGPLAKEYFVAEEEGLYEVIYRLEAADLEMECSERFEVKDQTVS